MPPPKDKTPDQRELKAEEYSDSIPDDDAPDPSFEPTYRDGSPKTECWDSSD